MEKLFNFGWDIIRLLQPLTAWLETEITIPVFGPVVPGVMPSIVGNFTLEVQEFIIGTGLVVILSAKVVKFILDLVPFA